MSSLHSSLFRSRQCIPNLEIARDASSTFTRDFIRILFPQNIDKISYTIDYVSRLDLEENPSSFDALKLTMPFEMISKGGKDSTGVTGR